MADTPPKPTYDLAQIKLLLRTQQFEITVQAARTAAALGFDEDDIYECVRNLECSHLDKSMPAEHGKYRGLWQDVYHVEFERKWLYVKLQMDGDDWFRVISFKENDK